MDYDGAALLIRRFVGLHHEGAFDALSKKFAAVVIGA
jgi:hypothetical protein